MTSIIRISSTAVVCQEAVLSGDITIGEGTIIQPKASIIAEAGPIIIGPNNIVEELVVIKNCFPENASEDDKKISRIMKIGANNIFEVGAVVESKEIGNDNTIETRAVLGYDAVVKNHCVIGMAQQVPPLDVIDDNTVVWGRGNITKNPRSSEIHQATHPKHLEILSKTLPNFHHLAKSNV